jgi:hypothetical protein
VPQAFLHALISFGLSVLVVAFPAGARAKVASCQSCSAGAAGFEPLFLASILFTPGHAPVLARTCCSLDLELDSFA